MSGLVDKYGKPISTALLNKKAAPPKLGEAFGAWAGRDIEHFQLPGGGIVQFDLSKLTLDDFAAMRDHYQINSSLAVLSFMQHQSEWHVESEDKKIADFCEEQLHNNWTMLNRGLSQANWAGFSPMVLDYENNIQDRSIDLNKVKDLHPQECDVNWKLVEGWAPPGRIPPKFKIYDGIKQVGSAWPIPVENTLWYPLLMENGDYMGRKLLRPAFTSWFFSILVHLFANRYYERFGEPVPIGRAPFGEELETSGGMVKGNEYMLKLLQDLRSRSVVVLPNDKDYDSNGRPMFDYDIEYLESQMRGADFERYMTRLDEEMSIGLFTPILLLRTADVGSYNLGVGHMQMYLWMLNAMNADRKQYIDKYLLRKMVNYNFSERAPDAKIAYRKMGNSNTDMISQLLVALVSGNKADVDLNELGELAGLTLTEVKQTLAEPGTPPEEESGEGPDSEGIPASSSPSAVIRKTDIEARAVVSEILNRVRPQVVGAHRSGKLNSDLQINMGFKRKMESAFKNAGFAYPMTLANEFYGRMDSWIEDALTVSDLDAESFMGMFQNVLDHEVKRVFDAK